MILGQILPDIQGWVNVNTPQIIPKITTEEILPILFLRPQLPTDH